MNTKMITTEVGVLIIHMPLQSQCKCRPLSAARLLSASLSSLRPERQTSTERNGVHCTFAELLQNLWLLSNGEYWPERSAESRWAVAFFPQEIVHNAMSADQHTVGYCFSTILHFPSRTQFRCYIIAVSTSFICTDATEVRTNDQIC